MATLVPGRGDRIEPVERRAVGTVQGGAEITDRVDDAEEVNLDGGEESQEFGGVGHVVSRDRGWTGRCADRGFPGRVGPGPHDQEPGRYFRFARTGTGNGSLHWVCQPSPPFPDDQVPNGVGTVIGLASRSLMNSATLCWCSRHAFRCGPLDVLEPRGVLLTQHHLPA